MLSDPKCIEVGSNPVCTAAAGLTGVTSLTVAPELDTKLLYSVSWTGDSLVWFNIE